jgi:hypothetical protein
VRSERERHLRDRRVEDDRVSPWSGETIDVRGQSARRPVYAEAIGPKRIDRDENDRAVMLETLEICGCGLAAARAGDGSEQDQTENDDRHTV